MADRAGAAGRTGSIPAGTPVPAVASSTGSFTSARSDLAVCFAWEGGRLSVPGTPAASALLKALVRAAREDGFKGKRRESFLWPSGGRFPSARYLMVGLGKREGADLDRVRDGCGLAARKGSALKSVRRMTIALPEVPGEASAAAIAEAATEGVILGSYRMLKYMTGDEARPTSLRAVDLLVAKGTLADARPGVSRGACRGAAVTLARDLVNEPAGSLTPSLMAQAARDVAKRAGLEIRIHGEKDLEKLGMGALLGVSAGSAQPPCLIHLTYRPRRARGPLASIALVGKGLTFDSGGLSLKTASGMETMKLDKAGASAVLAVMSALPALAPNVVVHGIMGMTENMPGGRATKPGDILRTFGGKTVEVLNTDAEGRLVLADALGYAQKQHVDRIIDLATLTGACMVALGPVVTGVFGNNQAMADSFLDAARRAGEKMWQLPLLDDYADQLRSDIADLKNSPTSRYGGAITASLFLKSFVDDEVPWLHLDIAGPAFYETEQGYMRKGATGAAVRAVLTYIEDLGSARKA